MQYLDVKTTSSLQAIQLTKYALLVALCFGLWFQDSSNELIRSIDLQAYNFLNGSLLYSRWWQFLCGCLCHPHETWLNIILMVCINVLGILSSTKFMRHKALAAVLYFWLFFQIVLIISHVIFSNWLPNSRFSPSLVSPLIVNLSETLSMPSLKISSHTCFPAGHALVAIYWARFSLQYSKEWLHKIIIVTAIFLILPRLFSGAHWLSDIVFTIFYALFWHTLAVATPLYPWAVRNINKFLIIFPKPQEPSRI